ncbi:hypothetical protein HMPREF9103_02124 [Lentilactobacillus parafarraginis F0439]|uniref:Uncharacterized protein n=1 Tax=Lentilactobacillus parafarraginis F0439 TaxID=797515 RepID=G9ZQW6_9LACO|nr:hypothetical protein HMPREF9103_02124 [Lentilactobacillus parafarraginis F0439]
MITYDDTKGFLRHISNPVYNKNDWNTDPSHFCLIQHSPNCSSIN